VSELTLMILRIGFLLLLWFFIFAIVYALRSDLFGTPVRRMRGEEATNRAASGAAAAAMAPAPAPVASPAPNDAPTAMVSPPRAPSGPTGPARYLVITGGKAAGTSIGLDDDIVTVGRSADSTLVIVDEYTSTYHAQLKRSGDRWTITDLDSTNGTKVSGNRITSPMELPMFTPVTIGTTTFELRPSP